MKVCLLNDEFPPVIDGVVNVVMNYAEYLKKDHGTDVLVGTPAYPGGDYGRYPYSVIPYQSFDTTSIMSGIRTGNPFSGKAVSAMAGFAPDLIHTHCPASATVIARILREETNAPVVLTYHTKYDIDIRRNVKIGPVAQEGIRIMVKNIEACDEIWTVSRGAGESLKALGFEGDYRVMNNGVDFAKGRVSDTEVARVTAGYDLPEGVPVFLYVGRLMTYKGLPLILDALKILADEGQDFRMVFVGKGPDRALLEKKARLYGLMGRGPETASGKGTETGTGTGSASGSGSDKCIFVGPVYDREVLRAWNTRANLFLFPSTFDTNGLVVREAAACGLASVLIRDSCAAEGITDGHNGFVIDETPEAMASLLKRLCTDLPYMAQVGDHAMEEIYMSWETCVGQAYERYQEILEEKARGLFPAKKKVLGGRLISATAWSMEEQDKLRRVGRELFHDFRETAVGMMENFQETASEMKENLRENAAEMKGSIRESAAEMKESIRETASGMKESIREDRDEVAGSFREAGEKAAQVREKVRSSVHKFME